ncbi:MAG: hypothetical protein J6P19_08490 [Acetobacter sp.]|nr:hypothetical protein [Acetobacter sp.]
MNDERNGPVIRQNISKAFCLIAYNAAETDRVKQQSLLNQVVEQVMALRYGKVEGEEEKTETSQRQGQVSDLSRMLFLLNRIDEFFKHDDAVEQLERFKGEVTQQLQDKLKKSLPKYEDVLKHIESIELAQICSLPAFLAVEADRLWEEPNKQIDNLKKIETFKNILPKDDKGENCLNLFPRNLKQLNESEKHSEEERRSLIKKLIDDTLEGAQANNFEQRLTIQIRKNLYDIVIGAPRNLYFQKEGTLLSFLSLLCEHHITRTEDEAKRKKEALTNAEANIRKRLQHFKELFNSLKEGCQKYLDGKKKF